MMTSSTTPTGKTDSTQGRSLEGTEKERGDGDSEGSGLGATQTIDSRRQDVASRIKDITGSGVDYSVEGTGNDERFRRSMELLNPKGTAALLTGASGPGRLPGGRKVLGIVQGDAVPQLFIPQLISLYRKGLFPFDRFVKFYDVKQINRAVADSMRGFTIKPVLRISSSFT
jgi:aryl-alcohol dehydrogenase